MTRLVVAGSFDPVTLGHMDLIARAAALGCPVTVVVGVNRAKRCMFSTRRRVEMIRAAVAPELDVEVRAWDGLIVDLCHALGDVVLVKGVRSPLDAANEAAQAEVNLQLGGVDSLWIPAPARLAHVSSTIVKDIALHGGDVSALVPPNVVKALKEHVAELRQVRKREQS